MNKLKRESKPKMIKNPKVNQNFSKSNKKFIQNYTVDGSKNF